MKNFQWFFYICLLGLAACSQAPQISDPFFYDSLYMGFPINSDSTWPPDIYWKGDNLVVTASGYSLFGISSMAPSVENQMTKVEVYDGVKLLGTAQAKETTNQYGQKQTYWFYDFGFSSKDNGKQFEIITKGYTTLGKIILGKPLKVKVAIQFPQYLRSDIYYVGSTRVIIPATLSTKGTIIYPIRATSGTNYFLAFSQLSPSGDLSLLPETSPLVNGVDAMTMDGNDNIYLIGGFTTFSGSSTNAYIAKYDATGKRLWINALSNGSSSDSAPYPQIVASSDTSIWVLNSNRSLSRFDSNGTVQQTVDLKTWESNPDLGGYKAVMTTANGRLTIAYSNFTNLVLKQFNPDGSLYWTQLTPLQFDTNSQIAAKLSSIKADKDGNLYVFGINYGGIGGTTHVGGGDAFVAKFTSTGSLIWANQFGQLSDEIVIDGVVDSAGNAYVQGTTSVNFQGQTNIGEYDVWIAKINASGIRQWLNLYGSSKSDIAGGLIALPSGNIVSKGYTNGFLDAREQLSTVYGNYFLDQILPSGERTYKAPSF